MTRRPIGMTLAVMLAMQPRTESRYAGFVTLPPYEPPPPPGRWDRVKRPPSAARKRNRKRRGWR